MMIRRNASLLICLILPAAMFTGCTDAHSNLSARSPARSSSNVSLRARNIPQSSKESSRSETAPEAAKPPAEEPSPTLSTPGSALDATVSEETFAGPERGDGWLTLRIRSALFIRAKVSAAKTHVVVRDGVVTLTGIAETQAQKELTEACARSVEGVRAVKNEMTVATPDRPGISFLDAPGPSPTAVR